MSEHTLLRPRFHCYVVGLVPPLLLRVEASAYIFLVVCDVFDGLDGQIVDVRLCASPLKIIVFA